MRKNALLHSRSALPLTASLLLLIGVSAGCGKKADPSTAPYANTPNPAAVKATPSAGSTVGARSEPPEAAAYRQKMGTNTKAPGAR